MRSLPPNLKAAAWVYQSAAPLWNRTEATCGPRRTMDGAQHFISLCRPQPKPCECLQLERDSVSLGLLAGIQVETRARRLQKCSSSPSRPIRNVCARATPDRVPSIYNTCSTLQSAET